MWQITHCFQFLLQCDQLYLIMTLQIYNISESLIFMDNTITQVLKQSAEKHDQSQFSTNEVLKQEKNNRTTYYLPCYVRFKVKEVTQLDIEALKATISGTLLFSFYYGNLDIQILNQFVGEGKKYILLQLGRQEAIQLKDEQKGITFKHEEKNHMIDYVVRDQFSCRLHGDVFYTPFQIINLFINITIQSIPLDPQLNKKHKIDIKFNCMHSDQVNLLHHSQNTTFGNYHVAPYFFDSKYKNSEKNPFEPISMFRSEEDQTQPAQKPIKKIQNFEDNRQVIPLQKSTQQFLMDSPPKIHKKKAGDSESKIKNFQYVHFRISMYKYPGVNLISIFIPLWILGVINLFIFFQDTTLADRIAGIATLTLAFIAFIPTINDKIPQTPNIKLVEILVYMQAAASLLCLIQSYLVKDNTDPYDWTTDGFFISAVILNLLTLIIVLLLFIIHKCFWEKLYIRSRNHNKKQKGWTKANWNNKQCDAQFQHLISKNKIIVV